MNRARWSKPHDRELDADTSRWWALQNAKGQLEREGTTYFADGKTTEWQVRRSVRGSVRQLDIIADGLILKTAGKRRVDNLLKRKS